MSRWSLNGFKVVVTGLSRAILCPAPGSTKGLGRACAAEMLTLGAHVAPRLLEARRRGSEVITARKQEEVEVRSL